MSQLPSAAPPGKGAPVTEEEKEAWIQGYAKYLEDLKVRDPAEYAALMADLSQMANQQGFEPVLPGGDRKLAQDGISDASQAEGIDITPDPVLVVKTYDTRPDPRAPSSGQQRKVFINLCTSSHIKAPSKKLQLQDDGTEQEGVNFPMSVGQPYPYHTKEGEPCVVYDCIFSPEVMDDVNSDKTGSFRHWVCEMAIQYVEQKYKVSLDHKYKLPKLKYMGDSVRSQRIRASARPTIEEVAPPAPSAAAAPAAAKSTSQSASSSGAKPGTTSASAARPSAPAGSKKANVIRIKEPDIAAQHGVFFRLPGSSELVPAAEAQSGIPVEKVVLQVNLEKLPADEQPHVEVAEELVIMTATGYHALDVVLPVRVDADGQVQAILDRQSGMLRIEMDPYHDNDDPFEADKGSKLWLLRMALDTGDSPASAKSADSAAAAKSSTTSATGYSGQKAAVDAVREDEELPEDRFHRADMVSQHLLMERAKGKAEREAKRKKEAEEKEAEERLAAQATAEAEAKAKADRDARLRAAAEAEMATAPLTLATSSEALQLLD